LNDIQRNPSSVSLNPGVPFDSRWVHGPVVPVQEIPEAARALEAWGGPREDERIQGLLKVLGAMDLTTLSGDDTTARVRSLCRQARSPLPRGLRRRLGLSGPAPRVAAVCVFPVFVPVALSALRESGVHVATVAAGFPHGLSALPQRVREVEAAGAAGAHEVDVVIRREWVLTGRWEQLYHEIRAFREAAGSSRLKVILSTGDLVTLSQVARATLTALMAGADFVKTSTGKEKVNATFEVGIVMARTMTVYQDASGHVAGLKPAGGIQTAMDGLRWLKLAETELGWEASAHHRFRIGASGLLSDVLGCLESALAE
jgi:deoxyribose-phosphate aldolase